MKILKGALISRFFMLIESICPSHLNSIGC